MVRTLRNGITNIYTHWKSEVTKRSLRKDECNRFLMLYLLSSPKTHDEKFRTLQIPLHIHIWYRSLLLHITTNIPFYILIQTLLKLFQIIIITLLFFKQTHNIISIIIQQKRWIQLSTNLLNVGNRYSWWFVESV